MWLLLENIKIALAAIRSNKMRSFLTMLGIIIGVSSVISITSIGDTAKGAVSGQFESVGRGYLYVYLNWAAMERDYVEEDDMFTEEEMEAVKKRFEGDVQYIAPYRVQSGTTRLGRKDFRISHYGVAANYNDFCKTFEITQGRMINQNDIDKRKDNVVIDVRLAQKVFGKEDVVGRKIDMTVKGAEKEFTIVGIYKNVESIFSRLEFGEPTYTCYVAESIAVSYPGEPSMYMEIYANPEKDVKQTGENIASYLCRIKDKKQGSYTYETAESQMSMINNVLGILSMAIGAIAAISLLVGGIGIMNIMLVSVTERTREIGIRKSLGARTKDILTQFLIEAMILSMIGGIIGTGMGIGLCAIGVAIVKVKLVINPVAVIGAVVFSAAVGLFFGIFPAKKAAKLDPIEALRYE